MTVHRAVSLLFLFATTLCISALHSNSDLPLAAQWTDIGAISNAKAGSTEVGITFALKQRNVEQLERAFKAISDPNSASYQEFMTVDQIQALVSPAYA